MSEPSYLVKLLEEHNVEFVTFHFTDPRGKWRQVRHHRRIVREETFSEGIMMDGSSIAGWQGIEDSDLILMTAPDTAVLDPFCKNPTLMVICNTVDPDSNDFYSKCPRQVGCRAENFLRETGIADKSFRGPEPELFVFQDVCYDVSMNRGFYSVDDYEGPYNSNRNYEQGNLGHRPPVKGGCFPVPPVDSMDSLRAEMLCHMGRG